MQDMNARLDMRKEHRGAVPKPLDSFLSDGWDATNPDRPSSYFAAAQVKFAASFVSPLPLYFAAFG
jgi:hypothetical protein